MAKRRSDEFAFLLLGGYDLLSGSLTELTDHDEAAIVETTPLGTSWAEHMYAGQRQVGLEQEGWYDDVANGVHDALSSGPAGLGRALCYGVGGTATGSLFVGWRGAVSASGLAEEGTGGAIQEHYERIVARANLHRARASYRLDAAGRAVQGRVLFAGTVTATGPRPSFDAGAISSQYGTVFEQIVSATMASGGAQPAPSILPQFQGSTDNVTFANILALASATNAARLGYHKRLTDGNRTAYRYFRIDIQPENPITTAFSMSCMFGFSTSSN